MEEGGGGYFPIHHCWCMLPERVLAPVPKYKISSLVSIPFLMVLVWENLPKIHFFNHHVLIGIVQIFETKGEKETVSFVKIWN